MPPRVVSLLLAFVLLWSTVATTQLRFAFVAGNSTQSQLRPTVDSKQHVNFSGSIDEHQVDDQPIQPHAEHVLDFALLLDTARDRSGQPFVTAQPPQPADVMLPSPYLEGLQRPPCAAIVLPA